MQTRKTHRQSITLPGRYIFGTGAGADAILSDLSPGGCRIDGGDPRLRDGAVLKLQIAGTGPFRAQVKWAEDDKAGVIFATKLTDDQFDRLAEKHARSLSGDDETGDGNWPSINMPHRFV